MYNISLMKVQTFSFLSERWGSKRYKERRPHPGVTRLPGSVATVCSTLSPPADGETHLRSEECQDGCSANSGMG